MTYLPRRSKSKMSRVGWKDGGDDEYVEEKGALPPESS